MAYTIAHSALYELEWLEKNRSLASPLKDQVRTLVQDLRFLRTYLTYMALSENSTFGSNLPRSTVSAALRKAEEDISAAASANYMSGTTQDLYPAVSCMLEKVKDLKPEIRKAYVILLKQSRQFNNLLAPLKVIDFTDSVIDNLKDLLDIKNLNVSMMKHTEFIKKKLMFLRYFIEITAKRCAENQKMGPLVTYVESVAAIAAGLSYLSWTGAVDEIMAGGMDIQLSDLLQIITPDKTDVMEMFVGFLKATKPTGSEKAQTEEVVRFVDFLLDNSVRFPNAQYATLHEELVFLMKFLLNLPEDCTRDLKSISEDIQAVARDAGSFEYQFHVNELSGNQIEEMNHVLSSLLEKMRLIKAEIFLIQLREFKDSLVDSLKDKTAALSDGLIFLGSFLTDPPEINTEDGNLFIPCVRTVANEVTCLIYSIHDNKLNGHMVMKMNFKLFLLLEKIKLIKAEVYLIELKNCKAYSMFNMEDQIENLHDGLRLLRTFLMDNSGLEDSTEDGRLFFRYLEAVTGELSCLMLSFCVKEMTKQMVDQFNNTLIKLLERIRIVKAEILLLHLQNHEVIMVVHMKDQIEMLLGGLRFLRSFLMDPPAEDKENGDLTLTKAKAVAGEVASLVCLFYENIMKEDMASEMNLLVLKLLEHIMLLKEEIRHSYLQIPYTTQSTLPSTDIVGFIGSLLKNLRELLDQKTSTVASVTQYFEVIYFELEYLKSFLVDIADQHDKNEELKDLWTSITSTSYEIENVTDSFVVGDGPLWYRLLWLSVVMEEIKIRKAKVMEVYDKSEFDKKVPTVAKTLSHVISHTSTPIVDDIVVGLNDELEKIVAGLTRGTLQTDIVSIIGMPGLGKTTLAKKAYNHPLVTHHFHIRSWCCVSQVYQRRELLLSILSHIIELTDQIHKKDDDDIARVLYQSLKGRRYVIVLDDLWNIGAWNELRESFPNNNNGSRVLFTSRLHDVALQAKRVSDPCTIRLLSDNESWELLQKKLFGKEGCPPTLLEVGKNIANNCNGLPLAVVVIAGLLAKTEKTLDLWKQVSENLSSHIASDPQRECMHILELSYKNLPDHLKSSFLYFGAFPEDKEIPVWKLLWLWIAEGFVQEIESKSLEDVAEDHLMDLIGRSLVTVAKRGSNGRVKSCRVHDLLRDLCLEKAKEENFLKQIAGYEEFFTTDASDYIAVSDYKCSSNLVKHSERRLCISSEREHFALLKPNGPHVRSLMFFASSDTNPRSSYDISFISQNFKFIRVLDLESINMGDSFPTALELLVLLKYLAVRGDVKSVPSSIAKLWNLETFLVKALRGEVELPDSFWSMASLRHVHINDRVAFSLQKDEIENSFLLEKMDTLSTPALSYGKDTQKILRRLPRLRKLRCIFVESWDYLRKCNKFPLLDFLTQLESLKIFYHGRIYYPCEFNFPLNLKKLTLSKFRLPWSEMSTIGKLPKLEVLKLLFKAFEGQKWEMRDGEFLTLKYLKMDNLNIVEWNATGDHLPCLKQLVLQRCKNLEEVPSGFGDISTLQIIEAHWCSQSAAISVKKIEKEQRDMGNDELKVLVSGMEKWKSSLKVSNHACR